MDIDQAAKPMVHYVGIGASAGGLEAIGDLFSRMPVNSGFAFIVIQHLSPDYKSLMVELLSKKTRIPVHRSVDGMAVKPNNIYMIPPKKTLTIFHGRLILKEKNNFRGINLPIDIFLRSLAMDKGEKSIAIILSGTGSDGTRGVRAVKERGGMVMVQKEDSAKFDGMPRAAITTGVADFILRPEEMADQLMAYAGHPYVAGIPRPASLIHNEHGLTRIFSELREKTGVDFTFYKPSTITRRIERRMTVNQINRLNDYVLHLSRYPGEVLNLYKELLIGVTSFFRDPKAMQALTEKALPGILKNIRNREARFWVAGCSTGEEAYTIAILAREVMKNLGISLDVKIFATDIDKEAIVQAGSGIYPESIAADLSPNLLGKYFYKKGDNYKIVRHIREMVVFARHNLVKDPPFTKIDLICCRNLLIYLQPVLQKKALEMFNFSLNPDGVLFLGTSETVGSMADYFKPVDHKYKIFSCVGKQAPYTVEDLKRYREPHPSPERARKNGTGFQDRMNSTELLNRYLSAVEQHFLPLSVVVNHRLRVVHVFGDTRDYFRVPSGNALDDITKMAQKDLSIPLATGIQKALKEKEAVIYPKVAVGQGRGTRSVSLHIVPLPDQKGHDALAAVFFMKPGTSGPDESKEAAFSIDADVRQRMEDLELELQLAKENLQATIEELETSNEELQATNEELLASNEELQSTNEELQSTNEELFTVNSEYQNKIIELTEINNDVENLLSSSGIGILILDEDAAIRKYSPQITRLFNIIENDIGRAISHISNRLIDFDLEASAAWVQKQGQPLSTEKADQDGNLYLIQVFPYLIGPETYAGTIFTFVDVSEMSQTKQCLEETRSSYARLFENISQGMVIHDGAGKILSANSYMETLLGVDEGRLKGRFLWDPQWRITDDSGRELSPGDHPCMKALNQSAAVKGEILNICTRGRDGGARVLATAIPEFRKGGDPHQILTMFQEVTPETNEEMANGIKRLQNRAEAEGGSVDRTDAGKAGSPG